MALKKKRELNPRQRMFVREWLKDQNATQAYLRVYGGSIETADTNGTRLLGNARIKQLVQKGLARLADLHNITAERNVRQLAEFAYHDKKLKPSDRIKACELIGRTFGQFQDVVKTTLDATVQTVDKAQAKKINDELEEDC